MTMKLNIELEVTENVDPQAVHQLLHWAKQVERSAAGLEVIQEAGPPAESERFYNPTEAQVPEAVPPGIPAGESVRRRGRPRKIEAPPAPPAPPAPLAEPASVSVAAIPPFGISATPPVVQPSEPAFPPFSASAFQGSQPVFQGSPFQAPQAVAMPPSGPVMPSPTGIMSVDEFRAEVSKIVAQNSGAWFAVATRGHNYATIDKVPAEQRASILEELRFHANKR